MFTTFISSANQNQQDVLEQLTSCENSIKNYDAFLINAKTPEAISVQAFVTFLDLINNTFSYVPYKSDLIRNFKILKTNFQSQFISSVNKILEKFNQGKLDSNDQRTAQRLFKIAETCLESTDEEIGNAFANILRLSIQRLKEIIEQAPKIQPQKMNSTDSQIDQAIYRFSDHLQPISDILKNWHSLLEKHLLDGQISLHTFDDLYRLINQLYNNKTEEGIIELSIVEESIRLKRVQFQTLLIESIQNILTQPANEIEQLQAQQLLNIAKRSLSSQCIYTDFKCNLLSVVKELEKQKASYKQINFFQINLPSDVTLLVISCLAIKELKNVMLVSREGQLATNDPFIWKKKCENEDIDLKDIEKYHDYKTLYQYGDLKKFLNTKSFLTFSIMKLNSSECIREYKHQISFEWSNVSLKGHQVYRIALEYLKNQRLINCSNEDFKLEDSEGEEIRKDESIKDRSWNENTTLLIKINSRFKLTHTVQTYQIKTLNEFIINKKNEKKIYKDMFYINEVEEAIKVCQTEKREEYLSFCNSQYIAHDQTKQDCSTLWECCISLDPLNLKKGWKIIAELLNTSPLHIQGKIFSCADSFSTICQPNKELVIQVLNHDWDSKEWKTLLQTIKNQLLQNDITPDSRPIDTDVEKWDASIKIKGSGNFFTYRTNSYTIIDDKDSTKWQEVTKDCKILPNSKACIMIPKGGLQKAWIKHSYYLSLSSELRANPLRIKDPFEYLALD